MVTILKVKVTMKCFAVLANCHNMYIHILYMYIFSLRGKNEEKERKENQGKKVRRKGKECIGTTLRIVDI